VVTAVSTGCWCKELGGEADSFGGGPGRLSSLGSERRSAVKSGTMSGAIQTKISRNGRVVLPASIRRRLGIRPGDLMDISVNGGRVVLTPRKSRSRKARIVVDPITGLPVLSAGPGAPVLTSKQVEMIRFGDS
jgi:AbrB family looped-hinge helix DNA binding protein